MRSSTRAWARWRASSGGLLGVVVGRAGRLEMFAQFRGLCDDCASCLSAGCGAVGGVRGRLRWSVCLAGPAAGVREYLTRLVLPRERNKTLTALAGAEPVVGAGAAAVQRLQFFLSEAHWDAEAVNARRLELLAADAATAPHPGGVLVVDDSGDRKDGHATAHVARQYLGSVGKTDNGIVAVSTLWADERIY